MASLRVAAYNFLGGGSGARQGHWSRLLARLGADVVLAQECRRPHDSPGERFRPAPTDTLFWARAPARRWGTAILLRGRSAMPLRVPGFAGWVVGAEMAPPSPPRARPLRLFSIHCPPGERGYIRTFHAILDRIGRWRDGADLVLGGDLNVAAGYRLPGERLQLSRGEREILDRLTGELDLISCWQAAHPGRPLAQTLRWSANQSAPYHCDGIFVPRPWVERLRSCRVVTGSRWTGLSDHNPVVAEFRLDSPPPDGDPGRPRSASLPGPDRTR